jgi:tripartite-type tricarboxylate transporter receptor subunit TctC
MIEEFVNAPEHKLMWQVMVAIGVMGRPLAAPPGVPAEAVKMLRAGFDATMKDPAYIAEMEKSHRELEPVGSEEVRQALAQVAKIPQATLLKLNEFIRRQ